MSRKKKLKRFAEIDQFSNVLALVQRGPQVEPLNKRGLWNKEVFKNLNPIVLELGCGKGEYTVGLAQKYKNKNFIGADLKGNRIWVGAKKALDDKIDNAAFLRTRIENIQLAFGADEVSEIWITFPDPQPQKPRERKRLTHPRFLEKYKQILKPGGIIHLKTDSKPLYDYTLEVIQEQKLNLLSNTDNLYASNDPRFEDAASIHTHYEGIFKAKGFNICYLTFTL